MPSKRPKPEIFTAPQGAVIITLTNDTTWARDVFDHMVDPYMQRVAQNIGYTLDINYARPWDALDELWDALQDDAFDGGHTTQGHYFFVVTVERDGQEDDVCVCSSHPLAHTIKDELLTTLREVK
jgi:hypothetical protein